MEGENNGTQAQQGTQQQECRQQAAQQSKQAQQQAAQGAGEPAGDSGGASGKAAGADPAAYEAQLAERDKRIFELEAQIAEAAKTAEATEALKHESSELKAQGESERTDFRLQLAGARNVKAARALLDEHEGDIEALKAAEPWLFQDAGNKAQQTGKTGLPNAGASADADKQMKEWREIAGLSDDK